MDQIIDFLLRWIHFFGGIIWVGHNYASMIQRPAFRPPSREDLGDEQSPVYMTLLGREHGTFRYAAIVTWLTGVGMLWQRDVLLDAVTLNGYLAVIGVGFWIGTLMLANLWLVLWPNQKKVLGFVPAPLEERVRCARITFLSSRTNTMLSIPLLFFMAASQHGVALFA
ncbi:MAG: urate hydroxylase PuuD [Methylotenera sp.]|nr:urate hydroxylase PuuD [Methylotenera sp.]MDZ4263485.1 urate hydroxylase PuuD [Pseudomonadota bacterium]